MTAAILDFVRPEYAFDAEVVAVLVRAYETAIASLHDGGQPAIVREIIARRIIEAAKKGERDPERLCKVALVALKNTRPAP